MNRRQFLATTAGLAGAACLGALPSALAATDLPLDIEVRNWRLSTREQIDRVTVELHNHGDDPIPPAAMLWGSNRLTQQPWDLTGGPISLAPGDREQYRIVAPGESCGVRLDPNHPAMVIIHHRDTQARATQQFVPEVNASRLDDERECVADD